MLVSFSRVVLLLFMLIFGLCRMWVLLCVRVRCRRLLVGVCRV